MRKSLALFLALILSFASPGIAQSLEDTVIETMEKEGYCRIVRSGTFLGRVRIVGLRDGVMREIVLNERTKEILRDVEFRSSKIQREDLCDG